MTLVKDHGYAHKSQTSIVPFLALISCALFLIDNKMNKPENPSTPGYISSTTSETSAALFTAFFAT